MSVILSNKQMVQPDLVDHVSRVLTETEGAMHAGLFVARPRRSEERMQESVEGLKAVVETGVVSYSLIVDGLLTSLNLTGPCTSRHDKIGGKRGNPSAASPPPFP